MLPGLSLEILLLFDVVEDLVAHELLVRWIEAEVEGDAHVRLLGRIDVSVLWLIGGPPCPMLGLGAY